MSYESQKKNAKVGDKLYVLHHGYRGPVEVLEADTHPFEYDQYRVRMIDSVASPAPEFWISERDVIRKLE